MKKEIDYFNILVNIAIFVLLSVVFVSLYLTLKNEIEFERRIYIHEHENLVIYEHCRKFDDKYYCYKGE